jgi:signal transduction histidine kinase
MRSLFLKIFLWFWLAMALVGLALVIVTAITQSVPVVARWRAVTGDALNIYAETASEILEREGSGGLARYFERVEERTRIRGFVLDEQGRELTGRATPPRAGELAARARESGKTEFEFFSSTTLAAQIMSEASPQGGHHTLVLEMPGGRFSVLRAEPGTQALRLLAVLLTAGVVCYWLARYVSSPVVKLRAGVRQLAEGDLQARVGASFSGRRDELVDLGKDFDLMAERIESLMLSQQRLINDISHELRSPLARLTVALELARQRSGTEASTALDRIEREAERLNELIGQLLKLARLESGEDQSETRAVDLARLVREVVADADFEAHGRESAVRLNACEEFTITGREGLLRSAIENVVRNGVRYTATGTEVLVSLSVEREETEAFAVVSVRDHGQGLPEAALADVFRPFYRVADARDRQTGGIGLGLAITERAIRLHNGTVRARNAVEGSGGLIIEIRLPASNELQKTEVKSSDHANH